MPYPFKFVINRLLHKEKTYTLVEIYIANHRIFQQKNSLSNNYNNQQSSICKGCSRMRQLNVGFSLKTIALKLYSHKAVPRR